MVAGWAVILSALAYLCALFFVAHYGDTKGRHLLTGRSRATIYALALAAYCTSWTFFGSVGLASRSGLDFLAIYMGPILVIGLGWRFVARVVEVAKAQNITSIADFLGARYGKSQGVAALVCAILVVGALPYIALQLKAVSASLMVLLEAAQAAPVDRNMPIFGDLALLVAIVLAAFAMAFGTRHIDATEHQDGLMLAIALESVVKLVAFLAVGVFVVYWMFGGLADLIVREAATAASPTPLFDRTSDFGTFLTMTVLSASAILLLPRQFHVTVVENRALSDVRRAAWMFPLYLVLINLFVIPIALAGEVLFAPGAIDRDMTVLALPLSANAGLIALFTFVGGLSAATAMVIVESVALAIMISNHLVMPLVARQRGVTGDLSGAVLLVRRLAIVAVIFLGYAYYRSAGEAELASIGLLSFAAVAQVMPAFLGGLIWARGTATGATAGLMVGFATWFYTLLLPSLAYDPGPASLMGALVAHGPLGIEWLKPTALFGLEAPRLTHGVFWSLALNVLTYVGVSHLRAPTPLERLQANVFAGGAGAPVAQSLLIFGASVSIGELEATVGRYLGRDRAKAAFDGFLEGRGSSAARDQEADIHVLRFAEHLLASAIGASSSRLVLSLLLRRRNVSTKAALKLLDDASAVFQYNRDMLQHALDHARQGITVLDKDLRLVAWNRAFTDLYELPPDLVRVGVGLDEIIRFNAERGSYGAGDVEDLISRRLESFSGEQGPVRLRLFPSEKVIELRTNALPDGGLVTTYTDITQTVMAEEALERANETLERRVRERTEELLRVNADLTRAKAEAEEANASKTRFLAAASHDILQPLNAARLYATSIVERDRQADDPALAENVEAALDAVEEILTALLDISRLDAGAMRAEVTTFRIDEILKPLQREFGPMAREKNLRLVFVPSSLTVRSDRRLLRRLAQNLISNAIKYTPSGKVLVGVRRRGDRLRLEVWDTGLGIPASKQKTVFQEFERLDRGARVARGLGLGLSIVERITRVLDHPIRLRSAVGKGSVFFVDVPQGAPMPELLPASESKPTPSAPLAGLSVLAIDNEPAIIEGMRTLLTGWGCRVLTAESLKGALAILDRGTRRPDVIIADYHLDDGDGLEAIGALRERLDPDMPAILLTADRTAEVRAATLACDIHLMNKPLKPAALRALLAQWRATRLAAE